jgi:hypothetical protein
MNYGLQFEDDKLIAVNLLSEALNSPIEGMNRLARPGIYIKYKWYHKLYFKLVGTRLRQKYILKQLSK